MSRGAGNGEEPVYDLGTLLLNRSQLRSAMAYYSLAGFCCGGGQVVPWGRRCAASTPTAKGDDFPRCRRWRRSFDVGAVDVKPRSRSLPQ
jgi:hypothetical protein